MKELPPSSLDSFLSLVLQPLPPDDAERRVPGRETVRPSLERTDSPALLPSGFRFSPEQPGFGAFPLWIPACAGMTLGRASAVWLAFVGGASVCPASEPCSYNGLNNRVLAAFRPVLSDVSHDLWRAPPAGRVLATPCRPARCRTLFNFLCSVFERLSSTFLDAAILLVAPADRRLQERLLVVIQHMWLYCKCDCRNPDLKDCKDCKE